MTTGILGQTCWFLQEKVSTFQLSGPGVTLFLRLGLNGPGVKTLPFHCGGLRFHRWFGKFHRLCGSAKKRLGGTVSNRIILK